MMISSADGYGEGWDLIDAIPAEELCTTGITADYKTHPLPTVLHYCQHYGVSGVLFTKYMIPQDIFTCQKPLLVEPADDAMSPENAFMLNGAGERISLNPKHHKRNLFATCAMTSAVNEAALFFKLHHCDNSSAQSETNKERSIYLVTERSNIP